MLRLHLSTSVRRVIEITQHDLQQDAASEVLKFQYKLNRTAVSHADLVIQQDDKANAGRGIVHVELLSVDSPISPLLRMHTANGCSNTLAFVFVFFSLPAAFLQKQAYLRARRMSAPHATPQADAAKA